jgi:hypothetical protein
MRAGGDGRPVMARKRWGLGVRIGGLYPDVNVAQDGTVGPLDGGMSMVTDWKTLPRHFVPTSRGGTNGSEVLFMMNEGDLPGELKIRQSGPNIRHHVLEARRRMPIDVYEGLLAGTQALWQAVEPANDDDR